MKKILSLVLALCVVLSMGAMAFAEEDALGITKTGTNYLCDERTTLTVCTYDGVSQAFKAIGNDLRFWQWLEEYTNVHIEWEVHSNADYATVVTTRLASGEIGVDIMNVQSILNGVNAGMSGLAAALSLDNMPNIVAYDRDVLPIVITNNTAADGNIYTVSGNVSPDIGHICFMYNTEWLEKIGKEVPTTLEEFYDVCVAMKEAGDLNGNGEADEIVLTSSSLNNVVNLLGNAFGLVQYEDCDAFGVDADGKVYAEIVSEEERECWEYVAKLYSEGILDQGISKTSADELSQKIAAGNVGIFIYYSAFAITYGNLTPAGQADPTTCHYALGEALTGPRGDKFYSLRNRAGNDSCIVNAKSDKIDLATRWLDALTCDPVVLKVRTCGWEGEHYTIDDQGEMHLIMPEDGSAWSIADLGCGQIAMPHYQNYDQLMNSKRQYQWYMDQYNNLLEKSGWVAPGVPIIGAYTEEEQELIDNSKEDCNAYFKEMRAKFITGEADIATGWDEYVSTMEALGLGDWIEAEQMIYERTK